MFQQPEKNLRGEFFLNTIVEFLLMTILSFALAWPIKATVNWVSESFSFGAEINFMEGAGFAAVGICLYNLIIRFPMPFRFTKKD